MQKLKKMVAYADTHFEKPFLILGLVAMILIICYQTLYRYLITFLIQFVGDPSNAWMIAPFCDPLALKNTISQYVGLSCLVGRNGALYFYLDIVSCHSSCDQRAQQYTRRYHL